jgi:uncharacterized membrane protein (DUF2068 family)
VGTPWRHFDWNVRNCGWHGHVTWAPTDDDLADRMRVTTVHGEAWRCLRCGAYVLGAPHGRGRAEDAPIVLRGRALRDAFILRLLAVERGIRGVLLVALAYGIYRFEGAQDSLQRVFDQYLPRLVPVAERAGVDLQSAGPVRLIQKALAANHHTLTLVSIGVLAYGALELLEAVGLWLMRRWGEYVAVVGTTLFIPLEIYEIVDRVSWLKVVVLIINVAAVVYLLWSKRLFGIRGGHRAYEEALHEVSLLEVERSAQSGQSTG